MKRAMGLLLGLGVLTMIGTPARAEPFSARRCLAFLGLGEVRQEIKCWGPDDYCAKKQPCPCPAAAGCRDDYGPKPCPCPPGPAPLGCVDDYHPRCCPIWLGGARPCPPPQSGKYSGSIHR